MLKFNPNYHIQNHGHQCGRDTLQNILFNKLLALVEAARAVKILYTLFNLMITKSFTLDMSGSNSKTQHWWFNPAHAFRLDTANNERRNKRLPADVILFPFKLTSLAVFG